MKRHGGHGHRGRHGNPVDIAAYIRRMRQRSRAKWQMPDRVVRALGLRMGDTVGEIGCGAGYFTERLAKAVGPRGRVFACDVEPQILAALSEVLSRGRIFNVTPVLSDPREPRLAPGSCDLVLLVNVLHHYRDTRRFLRALRPLLTRTGRLVNVDFVKRELPVGPPPAEKLSREAFLRQARTAGFRPVRERGFLPYQYFVELRRR